MDLYTEGFYQQMQSQSHEAAAMALPILQRYFHIQSAVDFGCGQGVWLAECLRLGVLDVMGVDGNWVSPKTLEIPPANFMNADLTKPVHLNRRFDLVLCLEVAEHLPIGNADQLVQTLVDHADVIMFSAAIPYQPGTHHVNCQWPGYWAEKFSHFGFVAYDLFRAELWNRPSLAFHYRQNMLLYVKGRPACQIIAESDLSKYFVERPKAMVLPEYYMAIAGGMSHKLEMNQTVAQAAITLVNSCAKKVQRIFHIRRVNSREN